MRIFGLDRDRPQEEQEAVERAARREWELIGPIAHEGFDSPRLYTETETGPALIYRLDETAERLDTFIAARQEKLNLNDRLDLVRELAETLDYAHRHGIVHRSLSPASIEVASPDALIPKLRIRDWHAGFQLEATGGHTRAVTSHAALLVADPAQIYLAPEAMTLGLDADTSVDVFSFGTVAYLILTGRPPAATPQELADRAREGLSLTAVLDGVPESLELLILHATQGDRSARPTGMSDVLAMLDEVDKETQAGEADVVVSCRDECGVPGGEIEPWGRMSPSGGPASPEWAAGAAEKEVGIVEDADAVGTVRVRDVEIVVGLVGTGAPLVGEPGAPWRERRSARQPSRAPGPVGTHG